MLATIPAAGLTPPARERRGAGALGRRMPLAVLLAALSSGGLAAGAAGQPSRSTVARQPPLPVATAQPAAVRRALREAESRHEQAIDEWIRIAQVPALPGEEQARGELVGRLFEAAGLLVRRLADGNVEGKLPGRLPALAPGVVAAHLDALHAPGPDNKVVRDGALLRGPGVLDDASGLAALVATARLLRDAGYVPDRELRFLATVGEEVGLVGSRSYVAAHPRLAAFVSVDGILGMVDHGATGITWRRFHFEGRGGHSLAAARTPSPAFAAGRALAALADLARETDDVVSVGQVAGGSAPNVIPTRVSITVDLRSEDAGRLERLDGDVRRLVRAAADREGVTLRAETLQELPALQPRGAPQQALVEGAAGILAWLGVPAQVLPRGSSDHVPALAAGIPGIAVGATAGRHAHAPSEVADIHLLRHGVQQVILLAVLLGEGLAADDSAAQ